MKKIYILFLLISASLVHATEERTTTTIYKYVDSTGTLHLTNKPPKTEDTVLYSRSYVVQPFSQPAPVNSLILPIPPQVRRTNASRLAPLTLSLSNESITAKNTRSLTKRKNEYDDIINDAATRYNLTPALLHAVIKTESNYNPNATSPKGAVGLMQLMPDTATRYGVSDRTNASENIDGGARYLRDLMRMFNNDTRLALAGYNAGENAVIKYNYDIPPYPETQAYVNRVLSLFQAWEG